MHAVWQWLTAIRGGAPVWAWILFCGVLPLINEAIARTKKTSAQSLLQGAVRLAVMIVPGLEALTRVKGIGPRILWLAGMGPDPRALALPDEEPKP